MGAIGDLGEVILCDMFTLFFPFSTFSWGQLLSLLENRFLRGIPTVSAHLIAPIRSVA